MCCRAHLQLGDLSDEELELILRVAGFTFSATQTMYRRHIDLGRSVWARASRNVETGLLTVNMGLEPTIGGHTAGEHKAAGQQAGIMFKVLQTLGERGGGEVVQTNLMGPCLQEGAHRVLAVYPAEPLLFENLCAGFRADLAYGIPQLGDTGAEVEPTHSL